jgi:hypothetical protein
VPGLIDGDDFPSLPGFPPLPGLGDSDEPTEPKHRRCDSATARAAGSENRTVQIDRSRDRSVHRRRSAVTERPHNARTIGDYTNGAGYNSRRSIPEARHPDSRAEDHQNPSYQGNHRAAGQHHRDHQTSAEQRSSRVGRHHADPQDDYLNYR